MYRIRRFADYVLTMLLVRSNIAFVPPFISPPSFLRTQLDTQPSPG